MKTDMLTSIREFSGNESGAAAVEYVVIAAALTTALIPGFYYVSSAVSDKMLFIVSFVLGS